MKRFYLHFFLFLLPVFIGLYFLPINTQRQFQGLKDDCEGHAIWMYDRIFENGKPVDLLFLGSSQTINGIDDGLIESSLKEYGINTLNFGYCRYGRNLHLTILKYLLKTKRPKYVVLEVRADENHYSHPIFPYLASTKDVLSATPFFNESLVNDWATHFSYKTELAQEDLYQPLLDTTQPADFGFAAARDTASYDGLKQVKERRQQKKTASQLFGRDFYLQFPRTYLKEIAQLCEQNNIQLFFLFFQIYGTPILEPLELKTYQQYGEVLLPPDSVFTNPHHWFDENHLNASGARSLSEWTAWALEKYLSN